MNTVEVIYATKTKTPDGQIIPSSPIIFRVNRLFLSLISKHLLDKAYHKTDHSRTPGTFLTNPEHPEIIKLPHR